MKTLFKLISDQEDELRRTVAGEFAELFAFTQRKMFVDGVYVGAELNKRGIPISESDLDSCAEFDKDRNPSSVRVSSAAEQNIESAILISALRCFHAINKRWPDQPDITGSDAS